MEGRIIALTGPSGAGKTTLGTRLSLEKNIPVPKHTTTRKIRKDDIIGFHRYLNHPEYANYYYHNDFFLSSGDGEKIKQEYGNFYGILNQDCLPLLSEYGKILIYVSYKDIYTLSQKQDYQVDILNLSFSDIEKGVRNRLETDKFKEMNQKEIEKRIACALDYQINQLPSIEKYLTASIYTDQYGIEETYEMACKILKI